MSEGSVFLRKDGSWCGKYKDASGKWKYLYRKTKPEANTALREALKDRDDGIIPAGKMTVGVLLDEWLEELEHNVSRRTWLNRESLVRVHIKPTIATKKLTRVTTKDIRAFYHDRLSYGLSASSVKCIHIILTQVFRGAVRNRRISSNPLDDVKPPKQESKDMNILSPSQVKQLIETARGDRFELIYVLGATCGLRVGEALALRHEDFDMNTGTMKIRRTLWRGNTYSPKTLTSRRTLKLPKIALEALVRRGVGEEDGWLFPTCNDTPVDLANFLRYGWKPMIKKAGLPSTLTYHKLRHGAASFLLGQSVPVPVVSKYLGHASPVTTYRFYAHVIDGSDGMAAGGIDEALG